MSDGRQALSSDLLEGVDMKKLLAHTAFYLILASALMLGSSLGIEITGSLWMQDISPGDEVSQEITLGLSQNDTAANYTLELLWSRMFRALMSRQKIMLSLILLCLH